MEDKIVDSLEFTIKWPLKKTLKERYKLNNYFDEA